MKNAMQKKVIVRAIATVVALGSCGVITFAVLAEPALVLESAGIEVKSAVIAPAGWGSNPLLVAQNAAASVVGNTPVERPTAQADSSSPAAAAASSVPELPADFVPPNTAGSTENAPFSAIRLTGLSSGQDAITNLDGNLEAVARWYGMSGTQLKELLISDTSVHIDSKGRILHVDTGVSAATVASQTAAAAVMATAAVTAAVAVASPFPVDQTFKLHSKPDSTRVLYLNFVGQGRYPAFDTDKVPGTFSNDERLVIQKVQLRVAEAYSAFDVDITTEPPALPKGKIGVTILMTPQTGSIGGYAYYNTFSTFAPGAATAFCYPNNLSNGEKHMADCIAHELGHTLGLTHQGQLPSLAYYAGQGTGETGWAPIMGVGYGKNLTQWAKGEYASANNTQDAYATMLRQGLSPRIDDHGNSIPFADALGAKSSNGLNNLTASGVIETPADIDMFQFFAEAGPVSLNVTNATLGGMLDVALQILDVNGKLLAASSTTVSTLAKTISARLPGQGMYYLSVAGAGRGNPLTTGYTKYGSIGQYNISGTSALATGLPGTAVIKTSITTGKAPSTILFDASGSTPAPGSKITSLKWSFGDGTAVASTAIASHVFPKAGSYQVVLTMLDSAGVTTVKGVAITIQ